MPYFLSRTRIFVFNDVMNDDMKYFKWQTASTNVCTKHKTHLQFYTHDKIMKKALCVEHGSVIRYRFTKPNPTGC